MDIERVFLDLECKQTAIWEEAKKKLVELFGQIKEQWVVYYMMEYYLKTGSLRVMEVLLKVQPPHDGFIFDRLAEWLKVHSNREHALNFFFFVVHKNPSWVHKVASHRLIKDILKLLLTEKEIVPLMSSLICIVTLLPIIPKLVPNFLNELCEVFAHLAAWNCRNPKKYSEEKIVHLQFGLQLLFQSLYSMYPCGFVSYLQNYVKEDTNSVFHHTIKPLLETVRMHPMLITHNTDTEVDKNRWQHMEPHDVVMECVQLSLPVQYQDCFDSLDSLSTGHLTPSIARALRSSDSSATSRNLTFHPPHRMQSARHLHGPIARFDGGNSGTTIWSPYNEVNTSGPIPVTPTPSHILSKAATSSAASNFNSQLLGITGSSPPEAAVEATPETTPMKDSRELKQQTNNPHAIRAIFPTSQPSSPRRRDQNHFNFSDMPAQTTSASATGLITTSTRMVTQGTTNTPTTYDRLMQQVRQDRTDSQSPFQTIESQEAKSGFRSPAYSNTPDPDSETSSMLLNSTPTPFLPTPTTTPLEQRPHIPKECVDCHETGGTICSAGGLHTPTSTSMLLLVTNLKRRSRIASYCGNDMLNYERYSQAGGVLHEDGLSGAVRRSKSCSSIVSACAHISEELDDVDDIRVEYQPQELPKEQQNQRRLQKSSKMLAIPLGTRRAASTMAFASVASQTVEILPHTYESALLGILEQNHVLRKESEYKQPYEKLQRHIAERLRANELPDQEQQFQLFYLQLQFERYRRETHTDRNRRLMGRNRDIFSLKTKNDQLANQLNDFAHRYKSLVEQMDERTKQANAHELIYMEELHGLKAQCENELDQNKCLREANEKLQARLNDELNERKNVNYELASLRGQILDLNTELQHESGRAESGLQCKQELARLEAEFIIMGEVQVRCRDRLAELDNFKARDEEMRMLQESYNIELKELRHTLEDKSSHLDSAKHKISELQAQLQSNEKAITEQKRLLETVKDEYEERFKALNKKYEVQKIIIGQMEEKIIMSLHKPQALTQSIAACSPDTDRTDIASSMERNSPLSTSLASSESLSASLRSTELRNLQQLVEPSAGGPVDSVTTVTSKVIAVSAGAAIIDGRVPPTLDLAFSANTAGTSHQHSLAAGTPPGVSSSGIGAAVQNYDEARPSSIGGNNTAITKPNQPPHRHTTQHQQTRP